MTHDARLVAEALSGGPEAFAQIIHHYKSIVFGVAVARVRDFHDAEDIAQTVFIEAFERLDSLKDPNRLGAWLRSITIHRCINHLQRRPPEVAVEDINDLQQSHTTPQTELENRELRDQVMAAIGRLSKVQRETVTLFYISDYSQHEIAAIQEVPIGTIKRRLYDARNKLKTEMLNVVEDILRAEAPKEDFNERVFNLLRRYDQPEIQWPQTYNEVGEELKKIGIDGIEGFAQAMELPHAQTRKFTIQMSAFMHHIASAANSERQEVIISLLKNALKDSNKKVRRSVLLTLTKLNVDHEDRIRKEFVPLIIPLLKDPSKLVRRRAAQELGQRWASDVPLEAAALALADAKEAETQEAIGYLVRCIIDAQKKTLFICHDQKMRRFMG